MNKKTAYNRLFELLHDMEQKEGYSNDEIKTAIRYNAKQFYDLVCYEKGGNE